MKSAPPNQPLILSLSKDKGPYSFLPKCTKIHTHNKNDSQNTPELAIKHESFTLEKKTTKRKTNHSHYSSHALPSRLYLLEFNT